MGRFNVEPLHCMIDLHLHLDGSLSPAIVRRLAELQQIAIPSEEREVKALLSVSEGCRDLNEYLEKFTFPCSLLQTEESIKEAFYLLSEELRAQGLIYAEIRFAPQKHCEKGMTQEQVVQAAIAGLRRSTLKTALIVCCMRGNDTIDANRETLRLAEEYYGRGVAALDLAGAEALFPTEDYGDLFAHAREKNIPYTIHAGEADGSASVRAALRFGTKRIGHGVRATEDETLVRELAEEGVTLEMCPTSNLNTAIVPKLADWPIRKLMDAGVKVTVNTDNMSVSATNLKAEYQKVVDTFGFSSEVVKQLLMNAAEASFAPESVKQELRETIEKSFR